MPGTERLTDRNPLLAENASENLKFYVVDEDNTSEHPDGSSFQVSKEELITILGVGQNASLKPIQETYDDIAALLADQGNQTTGWLQKVLDASADPEVTSGIAYYEKLAASTADLDDYDRLTNEQAAAIEASQENQFKIDAITDTAPTDVDPLKAKIHYDNGDDSVIGILFPAVYSLYLKGMDDADTAGVLDMSMSVYNKTKNKWFGGIASGFALVNTAFYKVDFGNATVDRNDFAVNDVIEVYFSAYKVGGEVDLSAYQEKPAEGAFTDGDKTKLDSIEASADVTDAANVESAGALMADDFLEENLIGTATYDATMTGTENLDLSAFVDHYGILTGNTTITVTNTPASGKSFVRNLILKTTATETLTLPVSWDVKGEFTNDTEENNFTIKFSNFPTVGLKVTCYINE